jgi:hypothetical protein
MGPLAHHEPARGGGGLQASGDRCRLAGHEGLVAPWGRDHLARVDPDPQGEILPRVGGQLTVQLGHGGQHGESGPHGPLGIVPMRERGAEHPDHGVPDELLQRSTVAGHDRRHRLEVGAVQLPEVLGIEPGGELGRGDEVGEEHAHDLPLHAGRCERLLTLAFDRGREARAARAAEGESESHDRTTRGTRALERLAAPATEPEAARVARAAGRALDEGTFPIHPKSVTQSCCRGEAAAPIDEPRTTATVGPCRNRVRSSSSTSGHSTPS